MSAGEKMKLSQSKAGGVCEGWERRVIDEQPLNINSPSMRLLLGRRAEVSDMQSAKA